MPHFDHERLDVYGTALAFVALAHEVANHPAHTHSHLADQLRRAATSIGLNIAEGAGELSPREKARFYRMAQRSATECAAILDVLGVLEGESEVRTADVRKGREMLLRTVSMLVGMVKATERRMAASRA